MADPVRAIAAIGIVLVAAATSRLAAHQVQRSTFISFGMEEGLSQASVEAMLQDSRGFIWVGTHDGLIGQLITARVWLLHQPSAGG